MFITKILREVGPYPMDWPVEKSYWGRSEDVFNEMMWKKYPNTCVSIRSHIPLVAGVWNDPRGGQAFIRGDKRYGVYEEAPHASGLYYEMLDNTKMKSLMESQTPQSFVDVCTALDWDYARDHTGDQKKYNQAEVIVDGPSEIISKISENDEEIHEEDKEWIDEWLDS